MALQQNEGLVDFLDHVASMEVAVAALPNLRAILDAQWFEQVRMDASVGVPTGPLPSDKSSFIADFGHPLRGTDWFEADQEAALNGRSTEVNADGKIALSTFGLDPLRTTLPELEARLAAYASISFRPTVVQVKLALLRKTRTERDFKNHLFEVAVIGELARSGTLKDIDDPATGVDAVVQIDGRKLLVEATNTEQIVLPSWHGVYAVSADVQVDQVIGKIRRKVAAGKQLATAQGVPTILFLALRHLGAMRPLAETAISECFADSNFNKLSGIVLADSWRLFQMTWHEGKAAEVPLIDMERNFFATSFARRPRYHV